jgi:hypothetical protein
MLKGPAFCRPFSLVKIMSDKPLDPPILRQSSRREVADYMNRAFETSDIVAICNAVGDATRLHNIFRHCENNGTRTTKYLSSLWWPAITESLNIPQCSGCDGLSA